MKKATTATFFLLISLNLFSQDQEGEKMINEQKAAIIQNKDLIVNRMESTLSYYTYSHLPIEQRSAKIKEITKELLSYNYSYTNRVFNAHTSLTFITYGLAVYPNDKENFLLMANVLNEITYYSEGSKEQNYKGIKHLLDYARKNGIDETEVQLVYAKFFLYQNKKQEALAALKPDTITKIYQEKKFHQLVSLISFYLDSNDGPNFTTFLNLAKNVYKEKKDQALFSKLNAVFNYQNQQFEQCHQLINESITTYPIQSSPTYELRKRCSEALVTKPSGVDVKTLGRNIPEDQRLIMISNEYAKLGAHEDSIFFLQLAITEKRHPDYFIKLAEFYFIALQPHLAHEAIKQARLNELKLVKQEEVIEKTERLMKKYAINQ